MGIIIIVAFRYLILLFLLYSFIALICKIINQVKNQKKEDISSSIVRLFLVVLTAYLMIGYHGLPVNERIKTSNLEKAAEMFEDIDCGFYDFEYGVCSGVVNVFCEDEKHNNKQDYFEHEKDGILYYTSPYVIERDYNPFLYGILDGSTCDVGIKCKNGKEVNICYGTYQKDGMLNLIFRSTISPEFFIRPRLNLKKVAENLS